MKEKYDIVIIGSGIGGLVCGCYLAKANLKVLIIEQHYKAGGYCTSFERNGFKFDVGVHYLGSLKNGVLRKVFDELEINLQVNRIDPCDKIIMPDNTTYIRTDLSQTIVEFKKSFPFEANNIKKFFNFINSNDFLSIYRKVKRLTFSNVLDIFFNDFRIKATINLLLGNIGLSAEIAAAVPAIILFREYILDCGYYPVGGMQAFADTLLKKFSTLGGRILFSRKVVKIITKHLAKEVILDNGKTFFGNIIVSNADATQTFKKLLDIKSKESNVVDKLIHSSSMFLVYLGLNMDLNKTLIDKANIWYFSDYDVDTMYSFMRQNIVKKKLQCVLCSFPSLHDNISTNKNKSTAILFIHAPYKNSVFWEKNKYQLGEKMIEKACEVISDLKSHIATKVYATPNTFYRYTSNKDGAFVGWLSTSDQINSALLPQKTSVEGVYLVGHWASMGYPGYGGIPNVAFSGRRGAMLISRTLGKPWSYSGINL